MGKAIDYALGQWPSLRVFLADSRLEIDNNRIENAIRPTAIGKKNWFFIGEAHAGERSAILYTVIESCRRRGLDPFAYLRDVFTRLPSMTIHCFFSSVGGLRDISAFLGAKVLLLTGNIVIVVFLILMLSRGDSDEQPGGRYSETSRQN